MTACTVEDPTRRGLRDGLATSLALAPVGLVVGTVTAEVMSAGAAWATGPLLVSGAAQMALVSLAGSGASTAATLATVLLLTSRCAIYGAALAPQFAGQPRWFRWLGAYVLIDQIYALVDSRRESLSDPAAFRSYYLALAAPIYAGWLAATALGVGIGAALPPGWRLELAVMVLIGVMLRGALTSRSAWLGAIVAGVVTIAASSLPGGAALIVGVAAGVMARRAT